jgi:hypothetical protein
MTGEVKVFPPKDIMTPEEVLLYTQNKLNGMEEVLTIGRIDGAFFSYTSNMSRDRALWLCKQLELHILGID